MNVSPTPSRASSRQGRVRHVIEPEPESRIVIEFDAADEAPPRPTVARTVIIPAASPVAAPPWPVRQTPAPELPARRSGLPPLVPSPSGAEPAGANRSGNSFFAGLLNAVGMLFEGIAFLARLLFVAFLGLLAWLAFTNGSPILGLVILAYAIYLLLGGRWFIFFF